MLTTFSTLDRLERVRRYGTPYAGGLVDTPLPGLKLIRATHTRGLVSTVYRPLVCIVIQGEKRIASAQRAFSFPAGHALVVTGDAPVTTRIVDASPVRPYLSAALTLDIALLQELDVAEPSMPVRHPANGGSIAIGPADPDILACFDRLLGLLDRPEAIAAVAPGIVRELHYWLLTGPHGPRLRALGRPDSHARRIARATALLRRRFADTVPGEVLAAAAGMSLATFHRHFKSVTGHSPLQFQKHLRLLEGRRLMQREGARVTETALEVGYESPSHFTRDYTRAFGVSPREERFAEVIATKGNEGQPVRI